jgi:response regulator NasT
MKSVIIAFSNPLLYDWIKTVLNRGGYTIEYACKTAGEVARVADFCTSPVVVCGFQFSDMTAEDLMAVLGGRLAMVTVVLPHQRGLVERGDMSVLPYPVNATDLLQAIEQAERSAAQAAITPARKTGGKESNGKDSAADRSAEDKLLILKAKEMLMKQFQMTESQAHRFLQKSSMDRGLKIVDAARMVLENSLV